MRDMRSNISARAVHDSTRFDRKETSLPLFSFGGSMAKFVSPSTWEVRVGISTRQLSAIVPASTPVSSRGQRKSNTWEHLVKVYLDAQPSQLYPTLP